MGCISSKMAIRSRSFQEELSQSLQTRINGLPALEDILISKNGGDQFLALVCTANTITKKLQKGIGATAMSSSTQLEGDVSGKQMIDSETVIVNTGELMADLEEQEQDQQQHHKKKKKQTEEEEYCSIQCDEINGSPDYTLKVDGGGGCLVRSIHTIEEYDSMVQASNSNSNQCSSRVLVVGNEMRSICHSIEKSSVITEEEEQVQKQPSIVNIDDDHELKIPTAVVEDGRDIPMSNEQGFRRRKAKMKDLSSLTIIPTIDPENVVGDCLELNLRGSEAFSNGTADYVTPKFGNFCVTKSLNICTSSSSSEWNNIFDPELLTSFEEAMKQLSVEEESILQQIIDSLEEENDRKEEGKECILVLDDQIQEGN